jgi:riboflavin transporter FmnP
LPIGFGTFFIEWGIGVGGGIGFLMMIIAGFMILTSAGDPKKLAAGKELLTAAIAGVLFMVLGLYILRVVGVDVLGIFPSAIGGGGSGGGGHVR